MELSASLWEKAERRCVLSACIFAVNDGPRILLEPVVGGIQKDLVLQIREN